MRGSRRRERPGSRSQSRGTARPSTARQVADDESRVTSDADTAVRMQEWPSLLDRPGGGGSSHGGKRGCRRSGLCRRHPSIASVGMVVHRADLRDVRHRCRAQLSMRHPSTHLCEARLVAQDPFRRVVVDRSDTPMSNRQLPAFIERVGGSPVAAWAVRKSNRAIWTHRSVREDDAAERLRRWSEKERSSEPRPQRADVSSSHVAELFRNTAPSGGNVRFSAYGRPWRGMGAASTPPRFPQPLPPYSGASEFRNSCHHPPRGAPTR